MERIPQYQPVYSKVEAQAAYDYLANGGWCGDFTYTRQLEEMIRNYTGAKYCTIVSSGTIALQIAIMACNTPKLITHIIIPDYTMPATAYAASLNRKPVQLIDVDIKTYNINYRKAWESIDNNTLIILLVHINGRYSDYRKYNIHYCIEDFKPIGLLSIEDACQALGSFHKGKHLGTFGDIGVLSFNMFKLISTGQGGVLLTDHKPLYDRIQKLKDFGRGKGRGSEYETLGMNAKFNDLLAVIGIEQFKHIEEKRAKKKQLWKWYTERLSGVEQVQFIDTNLDDCTPWYIDPLVKDRDKLIVYLDNNGIETQPFYPPLHRLKYYSYLHYTDKDFPNACYISEHGIWLPSSLNLTEETVDYICEKVRSFYK